MLYSAIQRGFYSPEIHGSAIPEDALDVSDVDYAALMLGQAQGKSIVPGPGGHPILQDLPPIDAASAIAARRFAAETAGINVNGMHLPTDRESQALVTGAALSAVIDPAYSCQWKTVEGFINLQAQQIISIASTMRSHVQACFDREAELLAAINAGTYTELMLDEGWPQ